MLYLDGKIGIVTGAAGGLGFEIAKELTKNGATVIITSRKKSKLTRACNLINKNCHGFELDVSNRKSVMKFIGNVSKKFDSVDILINNAGFPFEKKIWFKKIHGISEMELLDILQVDLIGTFRVTKEILKLMIKKRKGVIINIASTPAISGHTYGSPYSIAKAGSITLTKHVALEYGQYNIRSFSVALGDIYTEAMRRRLSRSELLKAKRENTMKRLGRPEEIAKSIVSIAGDNFSFSTGNTIIIDGGKIII
ncbi:MAG: SDR family oxidoreductase [Nitrososphaeraceae archaeon]|nr:SDR family oxidoreductase [Nitrososphaeraceae archaeon]MDW0288755.1 SDR family oxidoreductase [Nitrososphaeraceae archaeon]MDW0329760.1 SDR family oxidoreductase [Nitrososphaeraceae archaeon]MDW0341304.1 SDR family oxidoreductase [Nitrososphaeraceae archaeon]